MSLEVLPNEYHLDQLNNTTNKADLFITEIPKVFKERHNRYIIKYKENTYKLNGFIFLRETISILRNDLNTKYEDDEEAFKKFGYKVRGIIKNNDRETDHFESLFKNFKRFTDYVEKYEKENDINPKDGFAKFLKDTIKISRGDYSVSCSIPSNFLIDSDPPNLFVYNP